MKLAYEPNNNDITEKKQKTKKVKIYSFGEEIGNSITHGVMAAFCLFSLPFLTVKAYEDGGWLQASCIGVFMISLFLMFISSTLYHSMAQQSRHKEIFRIFDHIFIYVAIAGTYTPIALCVIGGWKGWLILSIQWLMVLAGVLYKSIAKMSLPKLSVAIYVVMGWTAVMFFPSLLANATPTHLWLIFAGGICYTGGIIFYASKFKFAHTIWHLFINAGAICHFTAIMFFLK